MKKLVIVITFYFASANSFGQITISTPAPVPDTTANNNLSNNTQTVTTPLQSPVPVSNQNSVPNANPTTPSAPVPTPAQTPDTSSISGGHAMIQLIYAPAYYRITNCNYPKSYLNSAANTEALTKKEDNGGALSSKGLIS